MISYLDRTNRSICINQCLQTKDNTLSRNSCRSVEAEVQNIVLKNRLIWSFQPISVYEQIISFNLACARTSKDYHFIRRHYNFMSNNLYRVIDKHAIFPSIINCSHLKIEKNKSCHE